LEQVYQFKTVRTQTNRFRSLNCSVDSFGIFVIQSRIPYVFQMRENKRYLILNNSSRLITITRILDSSNNVQSCNIIFCRLFLFCCHWHKFWVRFVEQKTCTRLRISICHEFLTFKHGWLILLLAGKKSNFTFNFQIK